MSDTPRTDTFYADLYHQSTPPEMVEMASGKERDFARTLERELAEACLKIQELEAQRASVTLRDHPASDESILLSATPDGDHYEQLAMRYAWLRAERHHGFVLACGGILPPEEIKAGQRWQDSSGRAVAVERVDSRAVYFYWYERGVKRVSAKEHYHFLLRYFLILSKGEEQS